MLRELTGSERKPKRIQVSLHDRWVLLGTSGTGKTTFSKKLLTTLHDAYPRVPKYILDTKQTGDFTGWRVGYQTQEPPPPIASGIQVWQPPISDPAMFNEWLKSLFELRKPLVLLIDELSSLGGENVPIGRVGRYPPYYAILLKQGRAAGMSVITGTQEAAYIPRQVIGQTSHLVRFRLQNEEDAKRADKILGRIKRADGKNDDSGEPRDKHGFFYARLDNPPLLPHYYPSYDVFFGRKL